MAKNGLTMCDRRSSISAVQQLTTENSVYDALRLQVRLLNNSAYNRYVRPILSQNQPLHVKIDALLYQIEKLDLATQKLSISGEVRLFWTDELIKWNPVYYSNITTIHVPITQLWIPDLALHNSAHDYQSAFEHLPRDSQAIVNSNGSVALLWPVNIITSCSIDVSQFPFDKQTCSLVFGSWTYSTNEIELYPLCNYIDLSNMLPHTELTIVRTEAIRSSLFYGAIPFTFDDVTYHLHIQRRPLHYLFNLILPSTFLQIISIMVFCLPPESGERVGLSVTLVLGMSVFSLIIVETMPASSESTPLIGRLFMFSTCLVATATVLTIAVLNLHYRTGRMQSKWLRWLLIGVLGRWLKVTERSSSVAAVTSKEGTPDENEQTPKSGLDVDSTGDWQLAARSLDRFCLIVFIIANIIGFLVFISVG